MYLALRDLRTARGRFAIVAVMVALLAVLATVLSGLAAGLVNDGISGLRSLPIDHLAFQTQAKSTFSRSTLDQKDLEPFRRLSGVKATPIGVSFVNARSSDGNSLSLALFGVDPDGFLADASPAHDQPALRAQLRDGLVLAGDDAGDVKVGDRVTISGADVSLRVIGFTFGGSYGHVPIAYTSLHTWQKIAYGPEPRGRFSAIALRAGPGADLQAAARAADVEVVTKHQAYAGSPGYSAETSTMTLIRTFLLIIAALVVGAFFTIWTIQRSRQIALLKAMGASTAYVVRDALGQLAVVVAASVTVGALVGVGIGGAMAGSVPFHLSAGSVVASVALLGLLAMVGAALGLRRVVRVDPALPLNAEP